MKIEMAKNSGFCMGVRNAILKIVDELNSCDENIYVYGPLIHNPQTVEVLKKRGLITINSLKEIKNKQIAIRTHGIPVDENRVIRNEASRTINLTCSRVARVQSYIKKYSSNGYFTIIIGDRDHAEVIGLKSYATAGVHVVSEPDDINTLPRSEKYLIVSQTTHERNQFELIVNLIREKHSNVEVIDTICDSTRLRQDDVREGIARGIDTLVVVGGKNSANTTRLAKIGTDNGIKTFHIETDEELIAEEFKNSRYVLVTAGASTPGWIINNVLEKLYIINNANSNPVIKVIKKYFEFFVRSNIISSIASFLMVLIAQKYAGIEPGYKYGIIAALFIYVMYTVNNYLDREFLIKSNSYKYKIYEKSGLYMLIAAIISFFISIYISYSISATMMYLFLVPYLLGVFYSTPYFKLVIKALGSELIKKIYNTKIVTGFGWLVVLILLPYYDRGVDLITFISMGSVFFTFVFLRQFIIDLVAFQGDLILGRDTLATSFGAKYAVYIAYAISLTGVIAFSVVTILSGKFTYLLFLLCIIYYLVLLKKIGKTDYLISLRYEFLIDANYILMALLMPFL
ncbi:MAG TPA: 4-hydroxy-3-methylbut-2-enyl diphosphate reductase [Spirochaetota bacterium]|nr:4-hydroxy-3-methylbut-2-enyl diphosphate reductase [Spirochaetota bacterium]HPF04424.1 4-hydroxy-3-methylbut-2-enyl diphosphate reductase [Spirochaetota bacterium]HPJ40804.1 4-hydroxy-3-methylbut-2-enyl diphosphate reductase [Spirochaetota bacterium]HPR36073.1 4-hydroxy-3-methylbut-2-enyl diphosphate reductase [Spirochaetota bacterium]HRX45987.1 4-hydroxy-3-methylbut-2-enyl diphosphate reductase [Spirochaetota bacterium]